MDRSWQRADVLIVGAGSAGSVLAERLSVDASRLVTVVEAGPGPSDAHAMAQITDGLRLPIGAASSVVRRYTAALTDSPRRDVEIMRGAVVGGSGAVNGGYFCRGLATDFDGWELPGWAWRDVLPHFRAIERDVDFTGPLHGNEGPILVRRVSEFDGCTASFTEAATEAGFAWVDDLNGGGPFLGVGAVPLNINRGTRLGPGGAFLAPAAGRENLRLLTETRVRRLRIVDGTVVGVDAVGPDGPIVLDADRIVLCGGAIGSAHLLLLSGIGNADELRPLGIEVHADLPVGVDTSDHPELVVPVGWTPTHDLPPLEAVLTTAGGHEIRPYTAGFAAMVHGPHHDPSEQPHVGVALMQPRARGRLTVRSSDPAVPPLIEYRYDSEPLDVRALRDGVTIVRELIGGTVQLGEAAWSTSQHLCGTARMGHDGDEAAVVDLQCRVRGISGLSVVDGSILPRITSRGPHATIAMLGHRAAEFIGG